MRHTHLVIGNPNMIVRYESKLSERLLDRIDIHIDVPHVVYDKLMIN